MITNLKLHLSSRATSVLFQRGTTSRNRDMHRYIHCYQLLGSTVPTEEASFYFGYLDLHVVAWSSAACSIEQKAE